jgi:hypothetical protein
MHLIEQGVRPTDRAVLARKSAFPAPFPGQEEGFLRLVDGSKAP